MCFLKIALLRVNGLMITRLRNLSYEICLRLGLSHYKRPYAYDADVWNDGYAAGEHEHYAGLRESSRYGTLTAYVRSKGAPLAILDIGCGTGLLRSHIEDRYIDRFVGTDISDVAVRTANDGNHSRSQFHVCNVPGHELGSFDVIVCNEMLYYVDDIDAFLSHIRRMLNPDGWLLTSITRHPGDFTLHNRLVGRFKKLDEVTVKSSTLNAKWRIACYAKGLAVAVVGLFGDLIPAAAPIAAAL
jgi:SAM-dependent methyltransferase